MCQTVVDEHDPAFVHPSKFVGQVYTESEAQALAQKWAWAMAADGPGWRLVVPSPRPQEVVELAVIEGLLATGAGVISCGGGGVPVIRESGGQLRGVEAVIDKDRTAGLLGRQLAGDLLLILTDVTAVQTDYGTPSAQSLHQVSVAELRAMSFPEGSMGPKVEAACDFVEATGGRAAIGRLADAAALLAGTAGTTVSNV
jgi:carbamate kinase